MMVHKKKFTWSWNNMFPCTSFSNPQKRHETNSKHLPEQQEPEGGAEPALCCSSPQRLSLMDIISNPGSDQISMEDISSSLVGSNLYGFSLDEIRSITKNFTSGNLGEGGFGAVYKGFISDKVRPGLEAQVVAVKVLDLEGSQGHKEWLAEVIFLGQLRHPNLVKLTGYCCEDDQRMLVYEYMERGNLDEKLFRRFLAPLPWLTRMKIVLEAAKGLAFLHGEKKPVIFRDFKAANILLAYDFTAKLSDFGFARDGPEEDKTHVTTKHRLGTRGYAAPEYIMTGHLTTMSDVYSFGVVLLELLTGRRSIDKTRPRREQNLVEWARPQLKDPRKVDQLMDPRLEGQYSGQGVRIAAALAYRCLSRHPKSRPSMSVVVKTLEPVINMKDDILPGPFVYVVPTTAADGSSIIDAGSEKKGNDLNKEVVMVEGRKEEAADSRKKEDGGLKKKKKRRRRSTRRKSGDDHVSRNRAVYSDSALDIRLRKRSAAGIDMELASYS